MDVVVEDLEEENEEEAKKKSLKDLEEEQKRAKAREQMKSDIYLTIAFALMLLLTGAVVAVRVGFTP